MGDLEPAILDIVSKLTLGGESTWLLVNGLNMAHGPLHKR